MLDAFEGFTEVIDVCEKRDANTRAVEWCEQAIDFAEQTEQATKREEFQERWSALLDTEEG